MSHSTNPETRKSRRQRVCSWCGQHIEIGELYWHWMYYDRYDTGPVDMHVECFGDFGDRGCPDFDCYENQRPEKKSQEPKTIGQPENMTKEKK